MGSRDFASTVVGLLGYNNMIESTNEKKKYVTGE
jgi:hypothetical protein